MHTFTHCREHSEQFAAEQGEREKEEAQAKKQQLAERLRLREEQRRRREAVREFTIKQMGVLQARLIDVVAVQVWLAHETSWGSSVLVLM